VVVRVAAAGERRYTALVALDRLVSRLDARDRFGLVAFDDTVSVVVPAGELHDRHLVRRAIASIDAGSTTNLSAGYARGVQEARRVATDAGATVLLLSDGIANVGVCEPEQLEQLAAGAQSHRITTTTLGLGLGYDEVLLSAIARGGAGSAHFAEETDTAAAQIAGEIDGLLRQAVQAANLVIRPTGDVASVTLHNDLPATVIAGGVMVELGELQEDETRRLVLTLAVPAMPALGLAKVADLTLTYIELPALTTHTIELPVHVNVVPGDQVTGRVPDPVVRSELAFQQAQRAKRRAGEALHSGASFTAALFPGADWTSADPIEFPERPYPGWRPAGSWRLVNDGRLHALQPTQGRWLDRHTGERVSVAGRRLVLGYGSNLNPAKLAAHFHSEEIIALRGKRPSRPWAPGRGWRAPAARRSLGVAQTRDDARVAGLAPLDGFAGARAQLDRGPLLADPHGPPGAAEEDPAVQLFDGQRSMVRSDVHGSRSGARPVGGVAARRARDQGYARAPGAGAELHRLHAAQPRTTGLGLGPRWT
jgi:Ca-activated chloride channel homolog